MIIMSTVKLIYTEIMLSIDVGQRQRKKNFNHFTGQPIKTQQTVPDQ